MTKLQKIEQDVANLSADDLARFRDWFDAFEAERFDRRIETDIAAGKLDELADAALAHFRAGRARWL